MKLFARPSFPLRLTVGTILCRGSSHENFGGFCLALLVATGLSAQNRSRASSIPFQMSPGPSAACCYPAGSSALPGVQRTVGSVRPSRRRRRPQIGIPGLQAPARDAERRRLARRLGASYPSPFPCMSADMATATAMTDGAHDASPSRQQQQQPNVIVVYPPLRLTRVTRTSAGAVEHRRSPARRRSQPAGAGPKPTHYLLAFKDHTIYSAVAYWVDGDTLHYFTSGNTHNQASVSLIDRDLTKRLNEGSGSK